MLLHGLKQRSLGFWRSSIDFVGQDHVGEDGTSNEDHFPSFAGLLQNFQACDVGWHEVGSKLDSLKFQVKNLGDGFYQERLGQTGSSGDQTMTSRQQCDQQLLDDFPLS